MGRRIKAAKDLLIIEHEQHINVRKERRDIETQYLVKGGHIKDPIKMFLGEDYNKNSSDIDGLSEIESSDDSMDDFLKNDDIEQKQEYEQEDAVTTVITSIHTSEDTVFDENDENDILTQDMMQWVHTKEDDKKLSVYHQRKEDKKRIEIRESKKKHQRKLKKMLKFVKEFQRNKKRRANGKMRKKKTKSSKKTRRR